MKQKIILIVIGTILNLSSTFAQTATQSYYYAQDVQNLQTPSENQTTVMPGVNPISAWCNDRLFILKQAKMAASNHVFRGDYISAANTLIQGLIQAQSGGYGYNPPMTQKLISRGVTIGNKLKQELSRDLNGMKGTTLLLENYYNLIEYVANYVDAPYYIPGHCGYCNHHNTADFENALIEMASEQLKLVNDALLVPGTVIPMGPSNLFLNTAEMITYFASFDVRSSLFANYYACQIRELDFLHSQLVAFNSTTQNEYSKQQMIYTSYHTLESVVSSLSPQNRCY